MAAGKNVPVSVIGSYGQETYATIAIGAKQVDAPGQNYPAESYWMMVIDLTSLHVAANFVSPSNTQVPSQLQPYVNNPQYLLIVVSIGITVDKVPQDPLYSMLKSTGAGVQLQRAEQINEQFSSGVISAMSYILAATMNPADDKGFEELSFHNRSIMTFELMPVEVSGKTIYTPIRLME